MKINMHITDRILRIILTVAIIFLYFSGYLSGAIAILALAVAIIFALTAFVGFCPLYHLLGITTKKGK